MREVMQIERGQWLVYHVQVDNFKELKVKQHVLHVIQSHTQPLDQLRALFVQYLW